MGFWEDITGQTAASASRGAASDTWQKQMGAIGQLNAYGDTYAGKFADLSKGYDPYVQTGYAANNQLQRLLTDPSSVSGLPGYQFAQDQGVQALDRSAASRGTLNSGRSSKDLLQFGTGLADQTYGNQLQRLLAANGQGMSATGAQNATVGQGLQGQLQTRQTGFGGQMTAAGTVGQGDVAAANAEAAGSQNILNTGMKFAGMAMGMPGGGFGGSSYGGSNSNPLSYSPQTNAPGYANPYGGSWYG